MSIIYSQRIYDGQLLLFSLGHNPGPIDGLRDKLTNQGIDSYFKSQNIHQSAIDCPENALLENLRTSATDNIKTLLQKGVEHLSDNEKRRLQAGLKGLGFYHGNVEGVIGPQSNSAIDAFNKTINISEKAPVKEKFNAVATPTSKQKWGLSVQLTGAEKSPISGNTMAIGELKLQPPGGGEPITFTFKSGGWGQYGDKSMLPGLDKGSGKIFYQLDWNSLQVNSKFLPHDMIGPDGVGSAIRLGTIREFTERG